MYHNRNKSVLNNVAPELSEQQYFTSGQPFALESGSLLPDLTVAFHTYGQYYPGESEVIWVCHALTANADVSDWWSNIFGSGKVLDPEKYFIVCANNLGSCYGTSSAVSVNPETGKPYGADFPLITIRDMVNAHQLLADYLGIREISLLIGGSQGGQQAMEWAISQPNRIENLILLATNARHSAWGIAFNEAQRLALAAGEKGIEAARAIAMLSYRNYEMYERTSHEHDDDAIDNFGASSYQRHQGKKLAERFDADAYYALSKAMDSHNVGRGRGGVDAALAQIVARSLVIGISSDLLFPIHEQELLAEGIPGAQFKRISSPYGHDGFLTEGDKLNRIITEWLNNSI